MIGGEAGQGLVTLSQILTKAMVRAGYQIVVTQSYQSRIRGGHNTYMLRVGPEKILAPREGIDVLVALNRETVDTHSTEMNPGGIVVLDSALGLSEASYVAVPFKSLTSDKHWNATAIGVLSELLGLDEAIVTSAVSDFFSRHATDSLDENLNSASAGREWVRKNLSVFLGLTKPERNVRRLMMNGNEAIALGALSAGIVPRANKSWWW